MQVNLFRVLFVKQKCKNYFMVNFPSTAQVLFWHKILIKHIKVSNCNMESKIKKKVKESEYFWKALYTSALTIHAVAAGSHKQG